jgi:hypothetical protein
VTVVPLKEIQRCPTPPNRRTKPFVNITYLHDYRRHRDPDEPLLTVDMFARRVGTSSSTVRRWMVEDGPIGPMPFETRAGLQLIRWSTGFAWVQAKRRLAA